VLRWRSKHPALNVNVQLAGAFTPVLSDWVQKKSKQLKFKTVFVSSDRNERAFREYLKSMSWDLALPFGDPAKDELSSRFRIRGIPTLVIVDAAGNFITDDARGMVQADPAGESFPWKKEGGPGGDDGGGGCVCM